MKSKSADRTKKGISVKKTPIKTSEEQRKSSKKSSSDSCLPLVLLALLILGVCIGAFWVKPGGGPVKQRSLEEVAAEIKTGLTNLYQHSQQTRHFWTQVLRCSIHLYLVTL